MRWVRNDLPVQGRQYRYACWKAGDLGQAYATDTARVELVKMSVATVERWLKPARDRMRLKGISTTEPPRLLGERLHATLRMPHWADQV